jgi:hypothetical protein
MTVLDLDHPSALLKAPGGNTVTERKSGEY